MPNPGAGGPFSIDGVWLSPWRNGLFVESERVHLHSGSPQVTHEVDQEAFIVPGRDEPIYHSSGVVMLPAGTLQGTLMSAHDLTHHQWLARLEALIENQNEYTRVWMQTPNRFYLNVRFGSWEDAYVVRGSGSFDVTLPFQVMRP